MKRLVFLLVAFMLVAMPMSAQKREPGKVKTLVIDPGHGGAKPGAKGSLIWEKDLVLGVALQFGKLVEKNLPDVKVIYTRTTDVDITLAERANIANKAKADLFISVHANSHPTNKPTGVETFVMGLSKSKANLEVAKKENADILLESDYQSNSAYQGFDPNSPESYIMFAMYQNAYLSKSLDFANFIQKQYAANLNTTNRGVKQAELFVIYKTAMPAVLTEIGFISNPEEEAFMMSEKGTRRIATCLYNAFATYKAHEEGTEPKLIGNDNNPAEAVAPVADNKQQAAPEHNAEKEQPSAQAAENKQQQDKSDQTTEDKSQDTDKNAEQTTDKNAEQVTDNNPAQITDNGSQITDNNPAQITDNSSQITDNNPAQITDNGSQITDNNPAQITDNSSQITEHSSQVTFRVQFLRTEKQLKAGDKELKGLDNFTFYKSGDLYCYMWGETRSMQAAKALQRDVRAKGFKDAFVVAFDGDKRISLQQATQMLMGQ